MNIITLLLKNKKQIDIELLDNPFIHEWTKLLVNIKNTYDVISWSQSSPYMPSEELDWEDINIASDKIKEVIDTFNQIGLNFPVPVEDIDFSKGFDADKRDLLNRLHRHFTTGENSFHSAMKRYADEVLVQKNKTSIASIYAGTWQYGSDYTFNIPLNLDDEVLFHKCLNILNFSVHSLEKYETFTLARRLELPNTRIHNIEFQLSDKEKENVKKRNKNSSTMQGIPEGYSKLFKQDELKYFSDDISYDVWLPLWNMQGKDYLRAYVEMDDPTEKDVHANSQRYTACFSIEDRSIMKDHRILSYLKSYGITPGPLHCGMPLGKVINKNKIASLENNPVVGVLLNGK